MATKVHAAMVVTDSQPRIEVSTWFVTISITLPRTRLPTAQERCQIRHRMLVPTDMALALDYHGALRIVCTMCPQAAGVWLDRIVDGRTQKDGSI